MDVFPKWAVVNLENGYQVLVELREPDEDEDDLSTATAIVNYKTAFPEAAMEDKSYVKDKSPAEIDFDDLTTPEVCQKRWDAMAKTYSAFYSL